LEQEKRQLEQELAKARFVVEAQARLHALVETISESEQQLGDRGVGRDLNPLAGVTRDLARCPDADLGGHAGRLLPAAPDQPDTGATHPWLTATGPSPRANRARPAGILDVLRSQRLVDVAPAEM
jgi:hypothetical protein